MAESQPSACHPTCGSIDEDPHMRATTFLFATLLATSTLWAQDADPGRVVFEGRCARCHGADGNGGELGPAIRGRLAARTNEQLVTLIRNGLPGQGMPPSQISDAEMEPLTRFLRTLQPRNFRRPVVREKLATTDGKTLEGEILNQGFDDLQLRTDDHRVHLLRRAGDKFREVTSSTDWPGYNGDPGGNRYTTLAQITKANVGRLGPKWIFTLPNAARLQVTPVVVGGIMYVSAANECYALDAGTGREIWHYRRPPTPGLPSAAVGGTNRGVATAGDRVFMSTDHAHLIALNRFTGELVWDTEMADWHQNYFATSAPLAVGNLVVAGTGGGEHGSRGFVAAFDQATGKEVWRFWTVPKPGEPAAKPGRARASSTAARPPGSPAPTMRNRTRSSGPPAIRARNTTATTARATICIPIASSRSMPRPANSSGTTRPRRTTCGIGMPPRLRWWWTPPGRVSRASC